MATQVFDIASVLLAATNLEQELQSRNWLACNDEQVQLVDWLYKYRGELQDLHGVSAEVSSHWTELNKFLVNRKFEPVVQRFDSNQGVGIATIFNRLVKWQPDTAHRITIPTPQGSKPGFELSGHYAIYGIDNLKWARLVEVVTDSSEVMWLFAPYGDTSKFRKSGLGLAEVASQVMQLRTKEPLSVETRYPPGNRRPMYNCVQVPMLDINLQPDLSDFCGLSLETGHSKGMVTTAVQQFRLRTDYRGVKVGLPTLSVTNKGVMYEPRPLVFSQPFYVWFTQSGFNLPLGTTYIEYDVMTQPLGSLDE